MSQSKLSSLVSESLAKVMQIEQVSNKAVCHNFEIGATFLKFYEKVFCVECMKLVVN